jgi:hypothetical protein
VDRFGRNDRASAVAAAVAQDLNDELTVILSSVSESLVALDPAHPAHESLLELQSAAQRCAWRAARLLTFSARRGLRQFPLTVERLLEEEGLR